MTMQKALIDSMHLPDDTLARMHDHGLAITDVDNMSHAIHDVYCGIMADHDEPNEKDRAQARQLLDALQKQAEAPA